MTKYQPLFHINLSHGYYADRVCPDLSISPTPACQALLAGHHMLVRSAVGSIQVVAQLNDTENLLVPLAEDTQFSFFLSLKNPLFQHITKLEKLSSGNIYLYNSPTDAGVLVHSQISVTQVDAPPTAFALVQIQVNPALFPTPIQEKEFTISFEPSEVPWKYYIVAPNGTNNDYQIEDSAQNQKLTFSKTLVDESLATQDVLAKALSTEFPEQRKYLFETTEAVTAGEASRKSIQLKRGEGAGTVLFQHLPNPAVEDGGVKILKL